MKKLSKFTKFILTGVVFGIGMVGKCVYEKDKILKNNTQRYLVLFQMTDQWVKVKQENKNLSEYFLKNGYKKIAIYGMGRAGNTLVNELRSTEITVVYGIDKRADSLYADIDIFSIDDNLSAVDAVVVTAVTYYDEIQEQLLERMSCPIISLEDIISDI